MEGSAFEFCTNIDYFQFLNATPIPYESYMLANGKPVIVPTEAAVTDYKTKWGSIIPSRHSIIAAFDGQTVHVPTRGTLNSVLTELGVDKETIAKLKLTGQINKADFDVMKSKMPALTYLDLSEVMCEGNKIPDNAIGDNNPYNPNKKIKTIILPESITEIGGYAFRDCKGLTGSLTIPNSVTKIGESAFYECTGFNGSLKISNSVTKIGASAFQNTGFTGSLTLPNSVTVIGSAAFRACSGFTGTLTIPNSLTQIGAEAFYECIGFNGTLTIPNSVTTIIRNAFEGCTNIEAFKFLSTTPITYNTEMLPDGKPVIVPTEAAVTAYTDTWGSSIIPDRHSISAASE